jgi:hypothetical protein
MSIVLSASPIVARGDRGLIVDRLAAKEFAQLPDGIGSRRIAVTPTPGNLRVHSISTGTTPFDSKRTELVAQKDFGDTVTGLAFNLATGRYICNTGTGGF